MNLVYCKIYFDVTKIFVDAVQIAVESNRVFQAWTEFFQQNFGGKEVQINRMCDVYEEACFSEKKSLQIS